MKTLRYLTTAIMLLAVAVSAHAIGIGFSVKDTGSSGQMDYRALFSTPIAFMVQRLVGTNLTLDTAMAKDKLFNYRLSIDGENIGADRSYLSINTFYSLSRFTWANTFGFGLIRTKTVRLWAGPQIALCYEFRYSDKTISDAMLYNKLGPVVGLNINAVEDVTVSLEAGFRTGFSINLATSRPNASWNDRIEPIMWVKLIFRAGDSFPLAG